MKGKRQRVINTWAYLRLWNLPDLRLESASWGTGSRKASWWLKINVVMVINIEPRDLMEEAE
jgi:hypothetical protein